LLEQADLLVKAVHFRQCHGDFAESLHYLKILKRTLDVLGQSADVTTLRALQQHMAPAGTLSRAPASRASAGTSGARSASVRAPPAKAAAVAPKRPTVFTPVLTPSSVATPVARSEPATAAVAPQAALVDFNLPPGTPFMSLATQQFAGQFEFAPHLSRALVDEASNHPDFDLHSLLNMENSSEAWNLNSNLGSSFALANASFTPAAAASALTAAADKNKEPDAGVSKDK
jgi:hypothetical protein